MSEVYKIQVNDSEPIEVSQQVYELSFCFNEMLKEKDKEIKRLNNIINEFEKWLDEEYQYADKHIFPGSMAGVAMGQINRTKNKLQELKGEDKK